MERINTLKKEIENNLQILATLAPIEENLYLERCLTPHINDLIFQLYDIISEESEFETTIIQYHSRLWELARPFEAFMDFDDQV